MKKQTIKCDVKNCKFNDNKEYLCCLENIDITCSCSADKCCEKEKTICNSFEKKEKNE